MIFTSLNDLPEEPVSHNPEIKKKVMLRLGDLPHLTNFSQSRFAPGQTSPAHAHYDMCEVFFVESGSGFIRVSDKLGTACASLTRIPSRSRKLCCCGTGRIS
ncbi:hypothetical protein NUACC26_090400 [Scytonema sp. NUACC26]